MPRPYLMGTRVGEASIPAPESPDDGFEQAIEDEWEFRAQAATFELTTLEEEHDALEMDEQEAPAKPTLATADGDLASYPG